MPKKGDILKFENYYKGERLPFIIYADTESLIKPIQTCEADPEKSYTKKYQKHEPISFSYYIKCFDDNVFKPRLRSYTGEDAMQKFVEWLENDVKEIANIPEKRIIFKIQEQQQYEKKLNVGYVKENLKRMIKKLETIVILLVNTVEPHTTRVILSIENLILHLWCFIILVVMIVIYL